MVGEIRIITKKRVQSCEHQEEAAPHFFQKFRIMLSRERERERLIDKREGEKEER